MKPATMELLAVLGLLLALSSTLTEAQQACPQGLSTANTTISTNDVILIKAPLLTYSDALTACNCFGDGWQLANKSAFMDTFHKSTANVAQANTQALIALLSSNFPLPVIAWFGYQYVDYSLNQCPEFEVNSGFTATELGTCTTQQAAICARSKLVYNALGSLCDNNLELCQRGSYCNAPADSIGTCVVDTICYPTNPCQAGLAGGYTSNPLDAYCTVNPSAPGGYTCDCGYLQAVSIDSGPQTCFECPSANPCAITRCPQGSSCSFTCGDRRGAISVAPNGTVVDTTNPSSSSPPPSATFPSASGPTSSTTAGPTTTACQSKPCGIGGTCQATAASYTCTCYSGFISNGGTCVPSPTEPYHTS